MMQSKTASERNNTYPSVTVSNAAHRIMADNILSWRGANSIDRIVPGNDVFIIVYFKDGTVQSYYCGMYMPDVDRDSDKGERLEAYSRLFYNIDSETEELSKQEDPEYEGITQTVHKKSRGR